MIRRTVQAAFLLSLLCALSLKAQQLVSTTTGVLHEVKTIQVEPTVVSAADKVKDPSAANLV